MRLQSKFYKIETVTALKFNFRISASPSEKGLSEWAEPDLSVQVMIFEDCACRLIKPPSRWLT